MSPLPDVVCQFFPGVCTLAVELNAFSQGLLHMVTLKDTSALTAAISAILLGVVASFMIQRSATAPLAFVAFPILSLVALSPTQISIMLGIKYVTAGVMMVTTDEKHDVAVPPLMILCMVTFSILLIRSHSGMIGISEIIKDLTLNMFALFTFRSVLRLPSLLPFLLMLVVLLIYWRSPAGYDYITDLIEMLF
jgi:hypothetical protein